MTDLATSRATTDEFNRIRTLLQKCELPTEDLTPEHLGDFLVARKGNEIVGAVGLEPKGHAALLRSLAVAESHRGVGVGERLLREAEWRARVRSIRRLYLLTIGAEKFFAKHGWQPIDRAAAPKTIQATPQFSSICPTSSVCMQRDLRHAIAGTHAAKKATASND